MLIYLCPGLTGSEERALHSGYQSLVPHLPTLTPPLLGYTAFYTMRPLRAESANCPQSLFDSQSSSVWPTENLKKKKKKESDLVANLEKEPRDFYIKFGFPAFL